MDNDPFAWEIGRKNGNTFEVMVSHACHPSSCKTKGGLAYVQWDPGMHL
jgi:hypothetical protein